MSLLQQAFHAQDRVDAPEQTQRRLRQPVLRPCWHSAPLGPIALDMTTISSTSQEVIVPLLEQAKAPGYRDSFTNLAAMRVRELAPDSLAIAPREGAGSVYG